jgi:acyl-CoA thioester hydrolase
MTQEKEPEIKVAARFQDCDPFGHLNNAKYLEYFINAREDHLVQAYGFDLNAHARESGCAWVIARHQIAYLAPVGIGEEVLIRTSLRRYTDQSALMEGRMYDASGARLKSLLWTDFAYVQLATGKPVKHGAEVSAFLARILLSEDGFPQDFTARERALAFKPSRA